MVMGWYVALLLGEKVVSEAASARRAVEDGSQQAALSTSGAYCAGAPEGVRASALIVSSGKPDVGTATSLLSMLGAGTGQRTFGYYVSPLRDAKVKASQPTQGRIFVGERSLGCLERPLDTPAGSISQYRAPIWITNLMGY